MFLGLFRLANAAGEWEMTESEYARKLDELDRLLNDPDVPMEPAKVWSLLAEIAQQDMASRHAEAEPGLTLRPSPRRSGTRGCLPVR